MDKAIADRLHSHESNLKRITKIVRDTNRFCNETEIVCSKDVQDSATQCKDVQQNACKPVNMIVLTQENSAKAVLANSIFGKPVLPSPESSDNSGWRPVRFKYGDKQSVHYVSKEDYDLTVSLSSHTKPWTTVPIEDLQLSLDDDKKDEASTNAVMEISLREDFLKAKGTSVIIPRTLQDGLQVDKFIETCCDNCIPVILYGVTKKSLSQVELSFLKQLKMAHPSLNLFFVCVPDAPCRSVPSDSRSKSQPLPDLVEDTVIPTKEQLLALSNCLQCCGYQPKATLPSDNETMNDVLVDPHYLRQFLDFLEKVIQHYLLGVTNTLKALHQKLMNSVISVSFDMQRDLVMTPNKIEFVSREEGALYNDLMKKVSQLHGEIIEYLASIQEETVNRIIETAENLSFTGVSFEIEGHAMSQEELDQCTHQVQDIAVKPINVELSKHIINHITDLKELYTGVLFRCLAKLETDKDGALVGTSAALRDMLEAVHQVEISFPSSSSILQTLREKIQKCLFSIRWKHTVLVDKPWKRKTALAALACVSKEKLAHSICKVLSERVTSAHERFARCLNHLQQQHSSRLNHTQQQWLNIRKVQAPRLAKLVLESTALCDLLKYGMPELVREVGRGQYGVVYGCDHWGSYQRCAVKSVVPPDEKHLQDLAMEFYYTKNLPAHDRVVSLYGCVIDYTYAGGVTPAVLLIMPRYKRDLHSAIMAGINSITRLQVAIDVVEALRFLHGQGLVHRDVKLKNVLMDKADRGMLTDLGFCKAEAMMSGSIVGTPVHMAPELFTGKYDNSVDTYAFGILFWYICAGQTRLPQKFQECSSKEELWIHVKNGCRPERLERFDERCWTLMNRCWAGEASVRPHLGEVQIELEQIKDDYLMEYRDSSTGSDQNSSKVLQKSSYNKNVNRHFHAKN